MYILSRMIVQREYLSIRYSQHCDVRENTRTGSNTIFRGGVRETIRSIEFKEQRLHVLVSSVTKMYAGQNNEHDHLEYGYASLDGLVSLNRLSVGCGTTQRRQSGDFTCV